MGGLFGKPVWKLVFYFAILNKLHTSPLKQEHNKTEAFDFSMLYLTDVPDEDLWSV